MNSTQYSNPANKDSVKYWLNFSSYVTKYRYNSYWHQLNEVFMSNPGNVLEIGVGPGVMASYLEYKGIDIITIDLETELSPTISASVVSLPFKDKTFDTVVCCQVLEHLPFEQFDKSLAEIKRVTKKKLVLSLPDKTLGISILARIPNFLFWNFQLYLPWALREPIKKVREHYWEIGRRGYPTKKILKHLEAAGFKVERNYRVPEYPYHHFFVATV